MTKLLSKSNFMLLCMLSIVLCMSSMQAMERNVKENKPVSFKDSIHKNLFHNGNISKDNAFYKRFLAEDDIEIQKNLNKIAKRKEAQIKRNNDLIDAAKNGNLQKVYDLLYQKEPANVYARDSEGKTALHYAIALGYVDIANALLDANSFMDAIDNKGISPLNILEANFAAQ